MPKNCKKTPRYNYWTGINLILWLSGIMIMITGCQNQNERSFSFGIIADTQYADKDTVGRRNYRQALEKLDQCVWDFNKKDLDFVIQLGDLIDGGDNAPQQFDSALKEFNRLKTKKFHVVGNHDFWKISRTEVMQKLNIEKPYYDFTHGNWRFVILDTMDLAISGGWPTDSTNYILGEEMIDELARQNAPNAVTWSGGISQQQIDWLNNVLTDADTKKQNTIVFGHIPLMPQDETHTLWNAQEIVRVLQSHSSVAAYINGHKHSGGFSEQNGIYYITIEAMVEAPKENAYAVATVYTDKIVIKGTGAVANRTLMLKKRHEN